MKKLALCLAVSACALLGACDEYKVKSSFNHKNATLSDFKSISRDEYAAALSEYDRPMAGSRWRSEAAQETLAQPQFADATFYSINVDRTNYYGTVVKSVRYCSILHGAANCDVQKQLTSHDEILKGKADYLVRAQTQSN